MRIRAGRALASYRTRPRKRCAEAGQTFTRTGHRCAREAPTRERARIGLGLLVQQGPKTKAACNSTLDPGPSRRTARPPFLDLERQLALLAPAVARSGEPGPDLRTTLLGSPLMRYASRPKRVPHHPSDAAEDGRTHDARESDDHRRWAARRNGLHGCRARRADDRRPEGFRHLRRRGGRGVPLWISRERYVACTAYAATRGRAVASH